MTEEQPYKPPFPEPLSKSNKRSWWQLYKRAKKSWLHTLYEGSYCNEMTQVKLPGSNLYMPKDPAMVKQVLVGNYKSYPKHFLLGKALKPLLGDSIFTTNGETWERQRRLLDPAFANAGLKKVFPLMVESVKESMERLNSHEDGSICDVDVEMTHVTADVIMRTILSVSIDAKEAKEVFDNFEIFQEKSSKVNLLVMFKLPPWLFPRDWKNWRDSGKKIREGIGGIIHRRFEEYQQKGGDTDYGDILEEMMRAEDSVTGTKFSEIELMDQVIMLFLAGHETSASVLGWTFYILANQPQMADRIAAEASSTFDGLDDVKFVDVHKLKWTRDVFREALRLFPPVAFFARSAAKDTELGGCPIKKLSTINISPWIIHRHRKLWREPDVFRPERFSEGENKNVAGAYLPFSMGPRICIGAAFAQQEALLILGTLTRNFVFTPVEGEVPEPVSRLTLRSANGIKLHIRKRTAEEVIEEAK
jgi:cytochrome P450